MDSQKLPITGPCPIDLDAIGFDRGSKRAHCQHCSKDVHNLSNMTEAEAGRFLRTVAGTKVCVSYGRDAAGRIQFAAPAAAPTNLVPLSRVRARRAALPAAAGVGLAAALAACTPHDNADAHKPKIEVVDHDVDPSVHMAGAVAIPDNISTVTPPEPVEVLDGEIEAPPVPEPIEMVEGKIEAPPVEMLEGEIEALPVQTVRGEIAPMKDEPCDGKAKDDEEPVVPAAGQMGVLGEALVQ
jgi:hypothetical protein